MVLAMKNRSGWVSCPAGRAVAVQAWEAWGRAARGGGRGCCTAGPSGRFPLTCLVFWRTAQLKSMQRLRIMLYSDLLTIFCCMYSLWR